VESYTLFQERLRPGFPPVSAPCRRKQDLVLFNPNQEPVSWEARNQRFAFAITFAGNPKHAGEISSTSLSSAIHFAVYAAI
jgi:hypothetical protein